MSGVPGTKPFVVAICVFGLLLVGVLIRSVVRGPSKIELSLHAETRTSCVWDGSRVVSFAATLDSSELLDPDLKTKVGNLVFQSVNLDGDRFVSMAGQYTDLTRPSEFPEPLQPVPMPSMRGLRPDGDSDVIELVPPSSWKGDSRRPNDDSESDCNPPGCTRGDAEPGDGPPRGLSMIFEVRFDHAGDPKKLREYTFSPLPSGVWQKPDDNPELTEKMNAFALVARQLLKECQHDNDENL